MKSRRDIKNAVIPHLSQNEGLAERIQDYVPFPVVWSKLDIIQTVIILLACEAELGNEYANEALIALLRYKVSPIHCPLRLSPPP